MATKVCLSALVKTIPEEGAVAHRLPTHEDRASKADADHSRQEERGQGRKELMMAVDLPCAGHMSHHGTQGNSVK